MLFDDVMSALPDMNRSELLRISLQSKLLADSVLEMTHVIKLGERGTPRYLHGTRGRLGGMRGRRVEFYPELGTRAYRRSKGNAWRVSPELVFNLETGKPLAVRQHGLTFVDFADEG